MGTSFIPHCTIIAVLIIAFLFASLPQVSHKTRYRVLYAIAIIMLFAVIPISECLTGDTKNSNSNYLLVLIFDVAVGYFCIYIAALLKFNVLKRKNLALENALTKKQQENVAILLEHQNEKQQALLQRELEWLADKIKMFTEEERNAILASACAFAEHYLNNKWLTDKLGKDPATFSKWVTNTTQPSLEVLIAIEVPVQELVRQDEFNQEK